MKSEIEWVPVEERLPDSERYVLIAYETATGILTTTARRIIHTRRAWVDERGYEWSSVLAWAERLTYTRPPAKPKPVTLYEDDWKVVHRLIRKITSMTERPEFNAMCDRVNERNNL